MEITGMDMPDFVSLRLPEEFAGEELALLGENPTYRGASQSRKPLGSVKRKK